MAQTIIGSAVALQGGGPSSPVDLTGANFARACSANLVGGVLNPPTDTSDSGSTTWIVDESYPAFDSFTVWKSNAAFVGGTNYEISACTGSGGNTIVMVAFSITEALLKGTVVSDGSDLGVEAFQAGTPVTPGANNGMVLSFLLINVASGGSSATGVDSPFTLANGIGSIASAQFGVFAGFHSQTTAGADNPQWGWTGPGNALLINIPFAPSSAPAVNRIGGFVAG